MHPQQDPRKNLLHQRTVLLKKPHQKILPLPQPLLVLENYLFFIDSAAKATLRCGDGQSNDFVRQTTMTFQTRTACRINTEDGERGALTASKSGTIQCSLSGERIRCK